MNLKFICSAVFSLAIMSATPSFANSLLPLAGAAQAPKLPIHTVAVNCSAPAQQVVRQTGGELLSASPSQKNGQQVCKITVLVKSGNGQRPKKMSVTVPAG